MRPPKCNRAFAEVLAASVERKERDVEIGSDVYYMRGDGLYRNGKRISGPLRLSHQPRLHQKNFDSAFILAIFLAACAVILCSIR